MKKAERTRQYIMEQAAPIINTKGMAGTSVDDIMTATKMAKGGLYGRFENREEMIDASASYLLKIFSEKIISVLMSENLPEDRILAYLNLYKNPLNPLIPGGCPILNIGSEVAHTNAKINKQVKEIIVSVQDLLTEILVNGIENGYFSPNLNAGEFILKTMAMLEGGVLISKVMKDNHSLNTIIAVIENELTGYKLTISK